MNSFLLLALLSLSIGLVACSESQSGTGPNISLAPIQSRVTEPNNKAELLVGTSAKEFHDSRETDNTRQLSDAPDLDMFRLVKELVTGVGDIDPIVGLGSTFQIGHKETFWLVDLVDTKTYQSEFTLRLITDHANWYVEEGLDVDFSALLRSANHFEEDIYPIVTRIFGPEWNPGVDGDLRLNILNARLAGVAGYFNSRDEYPTALLPLSNQRKIIYINALDIPPGDINYDLVLSHELQHVIQWNADASEDTWVNEGLSELSSSVALGSTNSVWQFLRGGPVSLTNWPTSSNGSINYYGAASLFMHFFTEHYGGLGNLRDFLSQPEDGIAGINGYLEQQGFDARFDDVFREWSVANLLDKHLDVGSDIPAYKNLEVKSSAVERISGYHKKRFTSPQYAVRYIEIESLSEPFHLSFKGGINSALLPVEVGPLGCWWSNVGDSIDSTLSRKVDLPAGAPAVLEYEVWFEIEEDWDYVYVETSVDGGESWRVISTPNTSSENPFGTAFGSGYTGSSDGWLKETLDLEPYVGENLWVRFQYVTDDAINASGACFKDLSIGGAEIVGDDGWEAEGFLMIDNMVRQNFQVQLITVGDEPDVRQLNLDVNNSGEWALKLPEDGQRLIVSVGSLAEKTRESTDYTIEVMPTS